MKVTKIGWIPKNQKMEITLDEDEIYEIPLIFPRRFTKDDWDIKDWPPRKVRITIEDYK